MEECQHSGDEGFDENDTPGPRKKIPIYKIGKSRDCWRALLKQHYNKLVKKVIEGPNSILGM